MRARIALVSAMMAACPLVSEYRLHMETPDNRRRYPHHAIPGHPRWKIFRCARSAVQTKPNLPEAERQKLVRALMTARRERDRTGVDKAKRALGERGPTWWKGPDFNRHLVKNTPYADWYVKLSKFEPESVHLRQTVRRRK